MHRLALLALATLSFVRIAHADDVEPVYACKVAPASTKISVNVKPDTSLADLAIWVTGFTCKNVVFSAEVAKRATKVNIVSSKPMSPAQAVKLFVDAVEATGLVVVQKPDTFIVTLGPGMPKACPDLPAPAPDPFGDPRGSRKPPADPPPTISDADLDAGIKPVDATHVTVTKALRDRILENPMVISGGARVVPTVEQGKPSGFKLYAIRPKALFARVGFVNGDQIIRVNGLEVTTPDKALEVYAGLRDAKDITFEIRRSGKPLTLVISVR